MKKLIISIIFTAVCITCINAEAIISRDTVIEIRSTGAATNGGGYCPAWNGIDYSQSDDPILTLTDVSSDTTIACLVSPTGGFTSAMAGNIVSVDSTGATNMIAGFYQIVTWDGAVNNSNVVSIDRVAASGASSGGKAKVGGAGLDINLFTSNSVAANNIVAGNTIYVKGAFNVTPEIDFDTVNGTYQAPIKVLGYGTTRGDAGLPTLTNASAGTLFDVDMDNHIFENLSFNAKDNSTSGNGIAMATAAVANVVRNCYFKSRVSAGLALGNSSNGCLIENCEFTAFATQLSTGSLTMATPQCIVRRCYFHDIDVPSAGGALYTSATSGAFFEHNIFDTISTGSGIYMQDLSSNPMQIKNNTFYYMPVGISILLVADGDNGNIINNIFSTCTTAISSNALSLAIKLDRNAFWNNTTDVTNVVYGLNDIVLVAGATGDPLVDAANANFALNDTSGGGADCSQVEIGVGQLGSPIGTSYEDIGALQKEDKSGLIGHGIIFK